MLKEVFRAVLTRPPADEFASGCSLFLSSNSTAAGRNRRHDVGKSMMVSLETSHVPLQNEATFTKKDSTFKDSTFTCLHPERHASRFTVQTSSDQHAPSPPQHCHPAPRFHDSGGVSFRLLSTPSQHTGIATNGATSAEPSRAEMKTTASRVVRAEQLQCSRSLAA